MSLKMQLTWLSVALYAAAALLWFISTVVKVDHERHLARLRARGELGPKEGPFSITEGKVDVLETIKLQSKWNRRAAAATCIAVAVQAWATAVPEG